MLLTVVVRCHIAYMSFEILFKIIMETMKLRNTEGKVSQYLTEEIQWDSWHNSPFSLQCFTALSWKPFSTGGSLFSALLLKSSGSVLRHPPFLDNTRICLFIFNDLYIIKFHAGHAIFIHVNALYLWVGETIL